MRVLALVPEAFGGCGGIAQYNRDLLEAICLHPDCRQVVALPRLTRQSPERLPDKLDWIIGASGSGLSFCWHFLNALLRGGRFDVVICSHVNLLPLAWAARLRHSAPLVLVVYGIEAWTPTNRPLVNALVRRVDAVMTISEYTLERFLGWSRCQGKRIFLVPNAIRLEKYGLGTPKRELMDRYKVSSCRIVLSLGRMSSTERYKGVDEVLEILPDLAKDIPDLKYIVAGHGDDLKRLRDKAAALEVADRVVFTGYVDEHEKPDHYRVADAFVLTGRGEGFGFVLLEAMACGIPVVASCLDGSREAVRDGKLGLLVDPGDKAALRSGILKALKRPRQIPAGLEYFSFTQFVLRVHASMQDLLR